MQWYEILLIVLAAGFVIGVVAWRVIARKRGKGGCDCGFDCSACAGCSACREKKEDKK